jgi:hypothetical protein
VTFELPGFSSGTVEDSIPPRLDVQDFFSDFLRLEDNGIIVLRKVQLEYPPMQCHMTEECSLHRLICLQAHSGIYYAEIKLAATSNKNEQQEMPRVMLNYRPIDEDNLEEFRRNY